MSEAIMETAAAANLWRGYSFVEPDHRSIKAPVESRAFLVSGN